jgi:hypothetical protein
MLRLLLFLNRKTEKKVSQIYRSPVRDCSSSQTRRPSDSHCQPRRQLHHIYANCSPTWVGKFGNNLKKVTGPDPPPRSDDSGSSGDEDPGSDPPLSSEDGSDSDDTGHGHSIVLTCTGKDPTS